MKKILAIVLFGISLALAQAAGSVPASGASGASSAGAGDVGNGTTGIRTPFFLGGALGFGSGTGVGSERGLGLRQIEPMIGVWFPGIGYLRVGYGFFDYQEDDDGEDKYEVEHSDFDVELGLHFMGFLYAKGSYSRVKELSDLGDVAWNEWGAGFGSVINIFAKSMLFAEVEYRWVLEHYDPFLEKDVNGSRLQMNIGFVVYVF